MSTLTKRTMLLLVLAIGPCPLGCAAGGAFLSGVGQGFSNASNAYRVQPAAAQCTTQYIGNTAYTRCY
jgi:hypothetical protein